jgi:hypothetical protein
MNPGANPVARTTANRAVVPVKAGRAGLIPGPAVRIAIRPAARTNRGRGVTIVATRRGAAIRAVTPAGGEKRAAAEVVVCIPALPAAGLTAQASVSGQ